MNVVGFSLRLLAYCVPFIASVAAASQENPHQRATEKVVEVYRQKGAGAAIVEARNLAESPLGQPQDFALVAGLYAENSDEATAETWYRKAVAEAPNDLSLRMLLWASLLRQQKFRQTVTEIEAATNLPQIPADRGDLYAALGEAYEGLGDAEAALCARGSALLEDPQVSAYWVPLEASRPSIPEKAIDVSRCAFGDWSLFRSVIGRGSPGRWSAPDMDDAVALYIRYADSLAEAGKAEAAQRFRRMAARAAVWHALATIREGDVPRALELFTLAERAAPISSLDEDYQIASLRDMMVAYGRSGRLSHAAAAFGRLMDVCHRLKARGEECPVKAVFLPMFAERVQTGVEIPLGDQVNVMHLALLMQRILASVSFDSATGRPYYIDGHDFVGPIVPAGHHAIHASSDERDIRPYGSVSAVEDLMTLRTENPNDYRDRAIADMKKGRFELIVKKWLADVSFPMEFGIAPDPTDVMKADVLGISFRDIQSAIDAAPAGSVPEPTLQAVRLAIRVLEDLRLLQAHK